MPNLETVRDALVEQLRDIYNAETQLIKALPKIEKKAASENLKELMREHLKETEEHVARLEGIAGTLNEKLTGKTCKAMKGLIEEGTEALAEKTNNEAVRDLLIIASAQKVEHYEISAYGTARTLAQEINEDDIAEMLQSTLDEEVAADEKLTALSMKEVLPTAHSAAEEQSEEGMEDEDDEAKESDEKSTSKSGTSRGENSERTNRM